MQDYQRVKQTKYSLPKAVYHSVLWRIRDYSRIKELADNLIFAKSEDLIGLKSSFISDKTANTVIKREKYVSEINQIDKALNQIPKEYQKGIWENIQLGNPYPLNADRSTYGRYKSKFIHAVAENFHFI